MANRVGVLVLLLLSTGVPGAAADEVAVGYSFLVHPSLGGIQLSPAWGEGPFSLVGDFSAGRGLLFLGAGARLSLPRGHGSLAFVQVVAGQWSGPFDVNLFNVNLFTVNPGLGFRLRHGGGALRLTVELPLVVTEGFRPMVLGKPIPRLAVSLVFPL